MTSSNISHSQHGWCQCKNVTYLKYIQYLYLDINVESHPSTFSEGLKSFHQHKTRCLQNGILQLEASFAFRVLTAKASWNSNTSISAMVRPAFSSTLGVAYVGLKKS